MKLTKLNGTKLVNISLKKYLIDWNRAVSRPQKIVKNFLFQYWKNCVVCEELRIPGSLLRVDLVNFNKKIIIEVSPDALHLEYNKFMHGSRAGFLAKMKSDFKKREWGERNGFVFIELYTADIGRLRLPLAGYKYIQDKFLCSL